MSNLNEEKLIAKEELSEAQQEAFDILENTKQNLFIQGQAGTGKSTFIMYLKQHLNKKIVVCSPTAVAALNVGGMTLHSFFKLPISDYISEESLYRFNRKKVAKILKETDLLIIDEVSMVRPDMLDAIDLIMKQLLKVKKKPFGGKQVLLIGDLYQLPPVITNNAIKIFENLYSTKDVYFFDSQAYQNGNFKKLEFDIVYRQDDPTLLNKLNDLRHNCNMSTTLSYFNSCKILDKDILNTAVTITPYRNTADEINQNKLNELPGEEVIYEAIKKDSFETAKTFPAPEELVLKEGALVMFNKNGLNWINGSTGIVEKLYSDIIKVRLLENNNIVLVTRELWENKEYDINEYDVYDDVSLKVKHKKEVIEKTTGTYKQFPLQLGYAVTIHKAQGKTLNKVNLDISYGAFAHGQLYVALSRTKTKDDINVLNTLIAKDSIISQRVVDFMKTMVH